MYNYIKSAKGRGKLQSINRGLRATRPPIGWRIRPTVVLIYIVNIMLQVLLPAIKLHLSVEQLLLGLSLLLLTLINCIEPQVEAGEVIIQILVEMGFIKARRAHDIAAPIRGGFKHLLGWSESRTSSTSLSSTGMPSLG